MAIAVKTQQYSTYILTDDHSSSRLEVVPERGGIITRWQVGGKDILYLDEERFTQPDLSVRGGIPILFPICGNLPDNTYIYEGKSYQLKQHGFARDLPWDVTTTSELDGVSITLTLTSNPQTLKIYPFDCQLSFTYYLKGDSLEIIQNYSNRSDRVLPFSTGLHPYFAVEDKSQLEINIPSSEFLDQKTGDLHPFNNQFDWNWDEIDVAFKQITANTAIVSDRSQNLQLEFNFDENYSTLVFWTVKGKPYYCLEPWTAGRNALNTGEKLLYLQPQTSLQTRFQIKAKNL
jgi:galactose mutarotase-like enzyme